MVLVVAAIDCDFNSLTSLNFYNVKSSPTKVEGVCDKCGGPVTQREDETEEAISNHLNVYNDQTAPLVGFYKNEDILLSVTATSSDAVIDAIKESQVNNLLIHQHLYLKSRLFLTSGLFYCLE